jgi:hypothetical protein
MQPDRPFRLSEPVYDRQTVAALRHYAKGYVHGHRVGGTNPSLVESMAAANAIIVHDNLFSRWVAGAAGIYFKSKKDLDDIFTEIDSTSALLAASSLAARRRHEDESAKLPC